MSVNDREVEKGFLSRWSRVKVEARATAAAPAAPQPPQADQTQAPPELPPVDTLTIDSDFSGFFHPKVDEDVRRTALRKLFSDPYFNVMDGLDVYIDDYSKSEPIPAAMLASLKQAQRILEWAADTEEKNKASVQPSGAQAVPGAASQLLPPSASHSAALSAADTQRVEVGVEPVERVPIDKP